MTALILIAVIAQVAQVAIGFALSVLLVRKILREKDAPKEAPSPAGVAEKESRDLMNEGFENIMGYSVNGKTGFESR